MTQAPQPGRNGSRLRQDLISGSFVRNAWYVAAWADDLGDGQLVGRTIMDEPVVLYRKADGRSRRSRTAARIVSRRCTWARSSAATASSAPITGSNTTTPARACTIRTAAKNIPNRARVKSYPVIEQHKAIWVWMGEHRPIPPRCRISA